MTATLSIDAAGQALEVDLSLFEIGSYKVSPLTETAKAAPVAQTKSKMPPAAAKKKASAKRTAAKSR